MRQFLGIDLGTSSVKCLVADESGKILSSSRRAISSIYPKPGHIEQEPDQWWSATIEAIAECVNGLTKKEIEAISFSGHMSAPVLLDKENRVLANAIMIADIRSTQETSMLKENFGDKFLEAAWNAPIDAFAVSKLVWLKKNRPEICEKINKVIFPKDFIRLKLCGHLGTDHTDAGNSLLYNYRQMCWDTELIKAAGLCDSWFPPLTDSSEVCGSLSESVARQLGLSAGTAVVCGGADMACSQIGSGGFSKDVIALTLSSSIQVVVPVDEAMDTLTGKMTYHPSGLSGNFYAMSSIFSGGTSVDWLYKTLNPRLKGAEGISQAEYAEFVKLLKERHKEQPISDVLFLPFLNGSGSPWFNPSFKGGFFGLNTAVTREDMALAVLEGIGYNILDNISIIEDAVGENKKIHLAGGGSRLEPWAEILASLLNRPIHVLRQKDVSALGAVILAGVGAGAFNDFEDCFKAFNGTERIIAPKPEHVKKYSDKYRLYQDFIEFFRR